MRIAIIVAMDKEFAQIVKLLENPEQVHFLGRDYVMGKINGSDVVLHQCGIGKVNAAIGTSGLIINFKPDYIISTGVAGGASTELEVQDVVVSTSTCYHDVYCGPECEAGQVMGMPAVMKANSELVEKALGIKSGVRIVPGLIATGDWFVDTREKMREILSKFPTAMAVDMETAAIAHVCQQQSTEFVSFRIISDIPLKDHKAEMYYNFWEEMAEKSFEVTKAFLLSIV